ncbi:heme oxygenase (biliverdin-producing) [Cellulomonas marina]|uniref:Heme oxygenase n=1 Tax=Cellulomonas marina TaxID=988821 RepID=A0A1I0YGA8_9CELL|nr:biliverdin-producing heme oxygenase [Cellulomonas marina]SFB11203.1 heme oxygenase [Cellulomonas marina]
MEQSAEESLSARLRRATRVAHERAEGTAFVDDLLGGRLGIDAHTALMRQLVPVYESLEAASGAGSAVVGDLLPAVARAAALRADLEAAVGPAWPELPLVPGAHDYAARVGEVAGSTGGWVAHAYTRYLGDLAGGQVVATAVRRHHGVPADALSFYRFDAAPAPVLRARFRERVDALDLADDEVEQVLAEAVTAFVLNARVLEDLAAAGHVPGAAAPVAQVVGETEAAPAR